MKRLLVLLLFIVPISVFSQEDYTWWNEIHGWLPGMPSWRSFMIISPGFLGPNALPVPEMKKGLLSAKKEIEFGTDLHFMEGDNTQNLSGRFYYPFAGGKIAVEVSGVLLEHYAMSIEIRDERVARDRDARGLAVGDLYFATMIQLIKDRKFPDAMLRLSCKTASGGRLDAARYADSPGYFFDLSFSKNLCSSVQKSQFVPYGSLGFYSWQTNDDMNLQNDALLYGAGFDIRWNRIAISNTISGYRGYKNNGDRPMVYTLDFQKKMNRKTARIQYLYGLHDWMYQTVKLSLIWTLD